MALKNLEETIVDRIRRPVAKELKALHRRAGTPRNGTAACPNEGMATSEVLTFEVPARLPGHDERLRHDGRVRPRLRLEMRVATLSALPTDARDQLFRFHEAWHNGRCAALAGDALCEARERFYAMP